MLPPGHLAGGYLASKIAGIWLPAFNQDNYLVMAMLFGLLPDLDFFYVFYKKNKFIADDKINHHEFLSHAPLLYLAVFLAWLAIFPHTWPVAVSFILGTWSHFLLDTVTSDGLKWLYPFNKKMFGFTNPQISLSDKNFLGFWIDFV